MFTITWMRATAVLCLLLWAPLCLAGNPTTGYDRMDGDFIKPSKREQPKRNFNLADQARSKATYTETSALVSSDDRLESRTAKDRNLPGRFRQPVEVRKTAPALTSDEAATEGDALQDKGVETVEAADVAPDAGTAPEGVADAVGRPALFNENQLVYCSKKLFEFHWDVDCPMLKNVKPTRLTYKDAREARYTECTACAARLLNSPATR